MNETNDFLQRIQQRKQPAAPGPPGEPPDSDDVSDAGSFGWIRSARDRAPMFEVRHANGDREALAYPYLVHVKYVPGAHGVGLVLSFTSHRVTLHGRNLSDLVRLVLAHRVQWVQVVEPTRDHSPDSATVITSATVEPLTADVPY